MDGERRFWAREVAEDVISRQGKQKLGDLMRSARTACVWGGESSTGARTIPRGTWAEGGKAEEELPPVQILKATRQVESGPSEDRLAETQGRKGVESGRMINCVKCTGEVTKGEGSRGSSQFGRDTESTGSLGEKHGRERRNSPRRAWGLSSQLQEFVGKGSEQAWLGKWSCSQLVETLE